jgi:hypothetical protein
MLTSQSADRKRLWVLVGVAMLVVALGSACTNTKSNGETNAPTATAATTTEPPTTSPPTTVALTPLPMTLTNADFRNGFSQDLRLADGVYTLTLTSNKPGPGVGVDVYELRQDCGAGGGIVAGSSVYLGKGESEDTGPTKPLKAGCYQLFLSNLSSATVTVKFAR